MSGYCNACVSKNIVWKKLSKDINEIFKAVRLVRK